MCNKTMRTPNEWAKNLKKGIVTDEMLGAAIFSVNKRAKNWRDKQNEYRNVRWESRAYGIWYRDYYDNESNARAKKEKYYKMKETLLKYVEPKCLHIDNNGTYLYYELAGYKFHSPVRDASQYMGLEVVKITDELFNSGHDITDLVSVAFVHKVISVLRISVRKAS